MRAVTKVVQYVVLYDLAPDGSRTALDLGTDAGRGVLQALERAGARIPGPGSQWKSQDGGLVVGFEIGAVEVGEAEDSIPGFTRDAR